MANDQSILPKKGTKVQKIIKLLKNLLKTYLGEKLSQIERTHYLLA